MVKTSRHESRQIREPRREIEPGMLGHSVLSDKQRFMEGDCHRGQSRVEAGKSVLNDKKAFYEGT